MNYFQLPTGFDLPGEPAALQLLTKAQAAERLQVSLRMLDRLVAERRLLVVKVGRHVRIPADALAAYVAERTRPAQSRGGEL